MSTILITNFGTTAKEQRDMMACIFYLMDHDYAFHVADDRGGSGNWRVTIRDDAPHRNIPQALLRHAFLRTEAVGTFAI